MNTSRTIIIAAVIAFIIGLLFGFGLKGRNNGKNVNLKQLLQQAEKGIEQLDKENKALSTELAGLKKDTGKKELDLIKGELEQALKDNATLKSEVSALGTRLSDTEVKLKAGKEIQAVTEKMKRRITELEKEKQDLNQVIDTISALTTQPDVTQSEQSR